MTGHSRKERVEHLLKEEIALMILHGEIKDPRVGFVTITRVRMSKDLKRARVFFSMTGSQEEVALSKEGLNSACAFIKRELARRLALKYIPTVSFEYDDTLDYADRIEQVLKKIKEED